MAIKVNVEKMKLGFTEEKKEIYVVRADRGSVIDTEKLSEEVAMDTGARPKQVKMVLTSMLDSILKWMEEGHGVRLDGFGTFLPVVKSNTGETSDDASVKRIVIRFIPSRVLSTRTNGISYDTSFVDDEVEESTPSQPGSGGSVGGSGDELTCISLPEPYVAYSAQYLIERLRCETRALFLCLIGAFHAANFAPRVAHHSAERCATLSLRDAQPSRERCSIIHRSTPAHQPLFTAK